MGEQTLESYLRDIFDGICERRLLQYERGGSSGCSELLDEVEESLYDFKSCVRKVRAPGNCFTRRPKASTKSELHYSPQNPKFQNNTLTKLTKAPRVSV